MQTSFHSNNQVIKTAHNNQQSRSILVGQVFLLVLLIIVIIVMMIFFLLIGVGIIGLSCLSWKWNLRPVGLA
jgi:hypothetical protein